MTDDTLTAAQARKANAEAEVAVIEAQLKAVELERAQHDLDYARANAANTLWERDLRESRDGFKTGVFRLDQAVTLGSVDHIRNDLVAYSQLFPEAPITVEYCSPGGNVLAGWDLFDLLRRLSNRGHHVTTRVTGYAASMAGVLLQAGDTRIIGAQSYLHLHQVSSGAIGKVAEMEDATEFAKKLTHQICSIYAERAGRPDDADEIFAWIERYERWLDAGEALDQGFVDLID